ncbi:Uncharacterized protein cpbgf_600313 [Cryptosporidium parvum]|uniref:Uncharacterized protein n=1 Tax=Cryptosporidium parvum TaxID=5807 RepID=A0A7S7LFT2_CRYPV|nr:Uncharacterized protein CPATCC_0011790 [Cryptosporidium parvum]WKS78142.1 hypothetical protein CPCDC_6g315 [Cryptosporidium sp. 43IA8]WRK32630.1 Uncharacterized protein cpbgf_600313 [Cryptosporidium parvum]|eukprot:QOY40911.1 hypothetical protein CPATCC_002527 [Cryptosporidium parvum]
MKLKYISSGILIIISLFGNSYQVQLNSKAKSEFPLALATGILGSVAESIKNGPIGGALMIPKDRVQGPYDDLSEDLNTATTDIRLEYESAKRRISKFRDELMGPVDEVLQTKLASKTQLMSRLEYVGKLLRAAYDQAHPDKAGLPIVLVQKTSADEMLYPPEGSDLSECAASVIEEADEEIELLSPPDVTNQNEILDQMDDQERYEYSSNMAEFFNQKANALKEELSSSLNTWVNNQLIPRNA